MLEDKCDDLDRPKRKRGSEKPPVPPTLAEKLSSLDINNGGCAAIAFAIFLLITAGGSLAVYYKLSNDHQQPPTKKLEDPAKKNSDRPNPVFNEAPPENGNPQPKAGEKWERHAPLIDPNDVPGNGGHRGQRTYILNGKAECDNGGPQYAPALGPERIKEKKKSQNGPPQEPWRDMSAANRIMAA